MSRWHLNRTGLLNFWYYQNQIFEFSDGKMLLRGTNGSGKSLTMQSLFPVLFDGDTSAYRLDSFGSRDRKMEDYLLGEKGVSNRDEGIGYLFLELKKTDRDEYLTIGIGMHAHRGGKLNKWFFALENNQRIGLDFELYEELRKGELTPLTKAKLKNRLSDKGRLFDNQKAYKSYVNERIFGFDKIEQFNELISLLINLRSPKLSKDFHPSVIYGILRDSLPRLKEDDLLTLSKTIEQIDGHRERLEDLSHELQDLQKFEKVYSSWKEEFSGQVAGKWTEVYSQKAQIQRKIQRNKKENQQFKEMLQAKKMIIAENELQLDVLRQTIDSLRQHEGMDLIQRARELQQTLSEIAESVANTQMKFDEKRQQIQQQKNQQEQLQQNLQTAIKDMEEMLVANKEYVDVLQVFDLDKNYTEKMKSHIKNEEFRYWKTEIQRKRQHLHEIEIRLIQLEDKNEYVQSLAREVGKMQQIVDELQRDVRHWQLTRQSEIERWKEQFDSWQKEAPFELTDQEYGQVLFNMEQLLEEEVREELIWQGVNSSYQRALARNSQQTAPLEHQIKQLSELKVHKEQEILEWQNKKMPEIEQRDTRKQNRQQLLLDKQILPFYQSVDFLASIPLEQQNCIEGALFASGILDSLIAEETGLQLFDDSQILPKPKYFASTLADYLQVNPDISQELQSQTMDVLQSILVDEIDSELPTIFLDGSYQIANIQGQMIENYQASYIGANSQERYRQNCINRLREEIAQIDQEQADVKKAVRALEQVREAIILAYDERPSGSEVYLSIEWWNKKQGELREKQTLLSDKERQMQKEQSFIREEQIALHESTRKDLLQLKLEVYQEAVKAAEDYEQNLEDAYQYYKDAQHMENQLKTEQKTLESLEDFADEYQESLYDNSKKQKQYQRLLAENQEQQTLINVAEITAKLNAALDEEAECLKQIKAARPEETSLSEKIAVNNHDYQELLQENETVTYEEKYWHLLFVNVVKPQAFEVQEMVAAAKEISRPMNMKLLKMRETTANAQFNFVEDQLQNYQPRLLNAAGVEMTEQEEQRIADFGSFNNYKEPQFTSEGQYQSVSDLLSYLSEQRLILQDLLQKDDERLFKNIILESVGNVLRARINQSQIWVEKMNELLQAQKNSSGLSLSIRWKELASKSEKDLGTKKLVALLQKERQLLSESDREAISHHFQEKVRFAQEQVKEENENNTLFQAIAQVLDYRDWFAFELRYKRANEGYTPQELTDRRFNQFSGGEKAIAMYLPLFAAVSSRYRDAASFSPRVITLDEAFAGIDDQNIAELFKACEQLGFNYVMNSQALFGDYPTVSKLMIYELLRPQNINLVTAIKYYWDGHQKQLQIEV